MKYKHHKEVTVDLHKIINRLIYMYTLWIFYRTMTNVPRRNNQNDEGANGDADAGGAGTGPGGDNQQGQNNPNNTNAHNYDACTSKNQSRSAVKCREEIQMFQQKVLKTLEQPHPAEPTEPEEYVDLALAAISRKMKDTLSKNEIMDLVEDIQQIVNRACREKRRRMELVTQNPPAPPPVTPHTSTDTMFGGPGPQGPLALQVQQGFTADGQGQYYNFN